MATLPAASDLPLATPIAELSGVTGRMVGPLKSLAIETLGDALAHLPLRYEDRRIIQGARHTRPGEVATVAGVVADPRVKERRGRVKGYFECLVVDAGGALPVRWYNQTYLAQHLTEGTPVVVHGRVDFVGGRPARLMMINPEHELSDGTTGAHVGRICPVYPLTRGIAQRTVRELLFHLAGRHAPAVPDHLPEPVRAAHDLPGRGEALLGLHRPPANADLDALNAFLSPYHRRLVFEELYFLQLALLWARQQRTTEGRPPYRTPPSLGARLIAALPFSLTGAQRRAVAEIEEELRRGAPMGRLLQGDVGSGKTLVALLACLRAVENGEQAALLVPTELLARQHLATVRALAEPLGLRVELLVGSLPARQRRSVEADLASGDAAITVGTHALFSDGVRFRRLGLVVVDEQHRFGVAQRLAMVEKGERPHLLAMTATPIPRTLALTLYGDLDLTLLDELPPGRQPVETVVRGEAARARLYDGVRRQVEAGHQAYFVYPTVDRETAESARSATRMAAELADGPFAGLRVGLVHGRMATEAREATMAAFTKGEIDILVATTVIEVGVDVANATVMVVEHAERFGLAQLHQLRGRVGRSTAPGYCVLMVGDDEEGEAAKKRLAILERTTDGFALAEADFAQRGPGEIAGLHQWGDTGLRFADPVRDRDTFIEARRAAATRLAKGITGDEVARAIKLWGDRLGLVEGG